MRRNLDLRLWGDGVECDKIEWRSANSVNANTGTS